MREPHFRAFSSRDQKRLQKDILRGKTPGKRERGRSSTEWSDIIKARMGSVVRSASQAQDRDRWRALLGAIQS